MREWGWVMVKGVLNGEWKFLYVLHLKDAMYQQSVFIQFFAISDNFRLRPGRRTKGWVT